MDKTATYPNNLNTRSRRLDVDSLSDTTAFISNPAITIRSDKCSNDTISSDGMQSPRLIKMCEKENKM